MTKTTKTILSSRDKVLLIMDGPYTYTMINKKDTPETFAEFLSYASSTSAGRWLLNTYTADPVIVAGLVAYVDTEKAKSLDDVLTLAGIDPITRKWRKRDRAIGTWNSKFKRLVLIALSESGPGSKAATEMLSGIYYLTYEARHGLPPSDVPAHVHRMIETRDT